jgi:hypothetical protein
VTLSATLLLAAVLIGTSAGQLLFKAASIRGTRVGAPSYWLALATDPLLWLALVIYVTELVLYMAFLSIVPLWQGVMVVSFDLLLVMIGGRIFFAEALTMPRLLAIGLIAFGVLLVGWGGS